MSSHVRQVRAFEGEIVEIRWSCKDGSTHYERYRIPPIAVRKSRADSAQGGVTTDAEGMHYDNVPVVEEKTS